jgi:hypothetical protein
MTYLIVINAHGLPSWVLKLTCANHILCGREQQIDVALNPEVEELTTGSSLK